MKRRTLQEYMEWLVVGREVCINGCESVTPTEVRVEPDGWLIVHHGGTYSKVRIDDALLVELVEPTVVTVAQSRGVKR